MNTIILIIYFVGMFIRGIVDKISAKNEAELKKEHAKEYGKKNSIVLGNVFYVFFTGSLIEASIRKTQFDMVTVYGLILYAFSLSMLFYVINQLKGNWTTKIIIAKDHKLNRSFLFRTIKHPNYFLNLIPEFIGFGIICKSWVVSSIVFPVFLAVLIWRIIIEQKVMKAKFKEY
jgi:isoprenylcysteine carboxyl methyltransferase (ICMT) family protein YpbQ